MTHPVAPSRQLCLHPPFALLPGTSLISASLAELDAGTAQRSIA